MTDTEVMYRALEKDPNDWDSWGVLADAHEDAGEMALAEAVRWMVEHRSRPLYELGTWSWFLKPETHDPHRLDPQSDLPRVLFHLLLTFEDSHEWEEEGNEYSYYETLADAVSDLAFAMKCERVVDMEVKG